MGIKRLTKVIDDEAPSAVKENEIKNYFGRKVALDASVTIYQSLSEGIEDGSTFTNDDGETSSHLMGMFCKTLHMIENGIKPVYVFDGEPPAMKKSHELAKRDERREKAQKSLEQAEAAGDLEKAEKHKQRLVKMTPQHQDECKRLLQLMGIPYIEAPCEAEAQCAALVKAGKVYAVGTEDMDALTFGSSVLLRYLTFKEDRKKPIKEFRLDQALRGLEMTQEQFVDLCILLGCDYCDTLRGIGPKRAVPLIKEHKTIEAAVKAIDRKKHPIPDDWPYKDARSLFLKPEVADPDSIDMKWSDPDVEGLVQYMVNEKGLNEERIRNGAKKLEESQSTVSVTSTKRKQSDAKGPDKKKAKKGGGRRGKRSK